MIVGVQFFRDEENDDRVTTTIIQDGPERKENGDGAYLTQDQVLDLLKSLGLNEEQAEEYLGLILHQPPKVRRRQFEINQEQEDQVRELLPGAW